MSGRRWRGLAAFGLALGPVPAMAHAFLVAAAPAVGGTVRVAPTVLDLGFSEAVEPLFCRVTVTDAAGRPVGQGKVRRGGGADHLAIDLKPLPPGVYHVAWRAVAADTHITQGDFTFTVAP